MAGTAISINQGTQTQVAGDILGGATGTIYQVVKVDVGALGASSPFTGAVSGTTQSNPIPTLGITTYGTLGTAGAASFGTLQGTAGAGTEYFVTGVSIVVTSGTVDCSILFGTNAGAAPQGTGVIERGLFAIGNGITQQYSPALNSGTNGQLIYWLGGAGTANFNIKYTKQASTL